MSDKAVFDLEQGHGNHFDCITEESDRDELVKQLPEMLQRAKLTVSPGALVPGRKELLNMMKWKELHGHGKVSTEQ